MGLFTKPKPGTISSKDVTLEAFDAAEQSGQPLRISWTQGQLKQLNALIASGIPAPQARRQMLDAQDAGNQKVLLQPGTLHWYHYSEDTGNVVYAKHVVGHIDQFSASCMMGTQVMSSGNSDFQEAHITVKCGSWVKVHTVRYGYVGGTGSLKTALAGIESIDNKRDAWQKRHPEKPDNRPANGAPPPAANGATASVPDQIREFAALRDQGILTEEEFQDKKASLLAQ